MPTKVLFTILNWGLGHASRSIPVVKEFLKQNIPIIIASDGEALSLLKKEFPNQVFETLPAYNVHYAEKAKNFDKVIFLQLNKLNKTINEEHRVCERLVQKHQITHIISDNRYGCYQKGIPSVILCHQLTLQHKNFLAKKTMNSLHFRLLNQFNKVWVPDFEGENALAGEISKTSRDKLQQKVKYIGALSRMEKLDLEIVYDYCFVLSGPEPQRSILEKFFLNKIKDSDKKIAIVRGFLSKEKLALPSNISVYSLMETKKLNQLICQSKLVICRAGYSSIMDLVKIEKPAILIPTPGQTEQEYLAKYLAKKKAFIIQNQNEISIEDLDKTNAPAFTINENTFLKNSINNFLINFAE